MAENHIRKRLYSDKEIGSLIQRATEIQRKASESTERGLSLQEVEHIAAEIGIDPEHLRTAAVELESRLDAGEGFRFWGGPFVLDQERVVEGTLTEEQWEWIVLGLRRLTGSTGTVNEIGQIREWTRTIKDLDFLLEQTQVTINPRNDQTTINVRKQYRGGARMAYVLSILLSGTVAGIFLDGGGLSDLMNAVILGGSGISGLAVVRTSMAYWTKRQREKLKELTDWLHETISQPGALATDAQWSVELPEFSDEEESQRVEASKRGVRG
jgi:hypothetical protein